MSKLQLIGLAGRKGSGKSTLAEELLVEHNFTQVSFADPIRNMLHSLFFDLGIYDGAVLDPLFDPAEKETPLTKLWGLTPRYFMQTIGDEWGRKLIHPDLWAIAAMKYVDELAADGVTRIVISDVRYPNEIEEIRKRGGSVIWIENGQIDLSDDHPSERSIGMHDTNHVITNNFSSPEAFAKTGAEYVLALLEEGQQ